MDMSRAYVTYISNLREKEQAKKKRNNGQKDCVSGS